MNKKRFSCFFGIGLTCILLGPILEAQLILVPEATIPVLVDGAIAENEWVDAISNTAISNLVIANPEGTEYSQNASVSLKWNGEFLYLLFQVEDSELWVDSADGTTEGIDTYQDDSIEIYIDVNNSNEGGLNREKVQYRFIPKVGGEIERLPTYLPVTGIEFAHQENPTNWVMEIAIPWDILQVKDPKAGRIMGFLAGVNDDDDGGEREAQYFWYATAPEAYKLAQFWGDIQLTAAKAPPPPPVSEYTGDGPLHEVFTLDEKVWVSWDQVETFTYQLQTSQDLSNWINDDRNLLSTGNTHFFNITAEDAVERRFFRVKVTSTEPDS